MSDLREEVRHRYAEAAKSVAPAGSLSHSDAGCCGASSGSCCGEGDPDLGHLLYDRTERETVPEEAVLASLGCGNPTSVAELREGEVVLDLGSGGGIDVLLSAARVGPSGKAYGLDMTDEMLALALENKRKAGVNNVEFLKGFIEAVPLPAGTVDVVISNCVINLSTDKQAVFEEMHRVLRPGGRIGITDVVASTDLSPQQRAERGSYVGCIAGALSFDEYERGLKDADFTHVEISPTHKVAEGMFSAVVKATRSAVDRDQLEAYAQAEGG
jgi:arsenite methyltransferase